MTNNTLKEVFLDRKKVGKGEETGRKRVGKMAKVSNLIYSPIKPFPVLKSHLKAIMYKYTRLKFISF
jgi:hypothetical protein